MMPQAGVSACRFLEWDSEFFGFRIARIQQSRLDKEALAQSLAWCRRERIDCLYFLADPDPLTIALAEAAQFHLVDIRVTLEARRQDAPPPAAGASIRPWMPADIGRLRSIAASAHRDSRFYRDGHFPEKRCDDLYSTWIEQSCGADGTQVFVAEFEQRAAGYVSCHAADHATAGEGSIGLLGVADDARDRGFGRNLVLHALEWFRNRSIPSVTVVTQGHNVAAQRLYQKAGFTTRSEQLWYHYWPGGNVHGSND
jgi:dTDP-4-amino-4,6-dideoxy-D-galactose acyltransferase